MVVGPGPLPAVRGMGRSSLRVKSMTRIDLVIYSTMVTFSLVLLFVINATTLFALDQIIYSLGLLLITIWICTVRAAIKEARTGTRTEKLELIAQRPPQPSLTTKQQS
jgi:hypothetical protein